MEIAGTCARTVQHGLAFIPEFTKNDQESSF